MGSPPGVPSLRAAAAAVRQRGPHLRRRTLAPIWPRPLITMRDSAARACRGYARSRINEGCHLFSGAGGESFPGWEDPESSAQRNVRRWCTCTTV